MKYVQIYKKALAITKNKQLDQENEEDMPWSSHDEGKDDAQGAAVMADAGNASRPKLKQKRVTNMSDVELYENRTQFVFEEDAGLAPLCRGPVVLLQCALLLLSTACSTSRAASLLNIHRLCNEQLAYCRK